MPKIAGFQDVILAEKHGFKTDPTCPKLTQIINLRGNHWITISNITSPASRINVLDNLLMMNTKIASKKVKELLLLTSLEKFALGNVSFIK